MAPFKSDWVVALIYHNICCPHRLRRSGSVSAPSCLKDRVKPR